MKLLHALANIRAIEAGIAPRHWGAESDESKAASRDACGYCAPGRPCCHGGIEGLGVWLKAMTQRRPPESQWLAELATDIRRQVLALPGDVPLLFARLYWHEWPAKETAHSLGITQFEDFWTCHDRHYRTLVRALQDWFPDEVL